MYRHLGFVASVLASAIGTFIAGRGSGGGLVSNLAVVLVTVLALGTAAYLLLFLFIALTATAVVRLRLRSRQTGSARRASSRSA